MSIGYNISKVLKTVTDEVSSERMLRAILLAQTLAFRVRLSGADKHDLTFICEEHLPELRKIANSINEHLAVDTKVLETIFIDIVKLRLDLICGVTDPALMQSVINSHSAELFLDNQDLLNARVLVNKVDFTNIQSNLNGVIEQVQGS